MSAAPQLISIPIKTLEKVADDPVKSARAVNLVYVHDTQPGIKRRRAGTKNFNYYFHDEKITDEETLQRIKKLVIPPAWENVWICKKENGHLQATGTDVKGRKQYRYHHNWN